MKIYQIRFDENGLADIKALPKNVRNRFKKEIPQRIGKDPLGCSEALRTPLQMYRSCHIGDYRVVFYLAKDIRALAIVGVGKHSADVGKDIYKRLEKLVSTGKLAENVLAAIKGFRR